MSTNAPSASCLADEVDQRFQAWGRVIQRKKLAALRRVLDRGRDERRQVIDRDEGEPVTA